MHMMVFWWKHTIALHVTYLTHWYLAFDLHWHKWTSRIYYMCVTFFNISNNLTQGQIFDNRVVCHLQNLDVLKTTILNNGIVCLRRFLTRNTSQCVSIRTLKLFFDHFWECEVLCSEYWIYKYSRTCVILFNVQNYFWSTLGTLLCTFMTLYTVKTCIVQL